MKQATLVQSCTSVNICIMCYGKADGGSFNLGAPNIQGRPHEE